MSLTGFKTVLLNNVIVNAGVPANVRATLTIGGISEEVLVTANSALVPTQTATVATVLDTRQVASLPLSSRNAADFVVFLPGVTTPGGTRDSIVNGLPQSTINMTLDGVNIQDNTLKSTDGFFAIVGPRLDAIEEISFTTAASGADSVGSGATQIRYTTKSGSNQLHGSVFHQYRSDALNTNSYFNKRDNLPKAELLQNQPGFNIGGPIMLPGFNGRNKAFFFMNYEELRQPSDLRRTRQIFHPRLRKGRLPLQHGGGGADGEPVRAGGAERTDGHAGSDHVAPAGRHPQRDGERGERPRSHRSALSGVLLSRPDAIAEPLPDRSPRLPAQRSASADLVDELPVLRGRTRYDEQPRGLFPRLPGGGGSMVHAPRHERLAAVDHQPDEGQRVPDRLRRRARHFLAGPDHAGAVQRAPGESGRLLPEHGAGDGDYERAERHERGGRRKGVGP